jgi:SulP family sulfate permease
LRTYLLKKDWLGNVRGDMLAGITVALALIPEAIAFSIIAGVDPMVGLHASFCIAVIIAFAGGRSGMISAATGAMALLMVTLVKEHGIEYLLAATVLTGIIQLVMGVMRLGRFITFVPQTVMIGFVNALAILIFMAQLPQFVGETWVMYVLVAVTLLIIYGLPLVTRAVPSALVAIIVVTAFTIMMGLDLRTVGDMGNISRSLPLFHLPQIPLTFETLMIVLPYALPLAIVGITESLLTATVVDEMTDTKSNKNLEVKGQGLANIVTGFFGGMAGCAMIGQSVINVKSGGRGRLSTLVSGVFLLILIVLLGDIVRNIPMAALVGVMIMVSVSTFNWHSLFHIARVPRADALVMIVTVAVVVYTHNLAIGVLTGVVLAALIFGWSMSRIRMSEVFTTLDGADVKTYHVSGQMFFGTMSHYVDSFRYAEDPQHVVIDFSATHVWDQTAVMGIAKVKAKYENMGKRVDIVGLNSDSAKLIERVGISAVSGGH